MSNWTYDSGGHKRDLQKYRENYEKIFGKKDKQQDNRKEDSSKEDNNSGSSKA